MPQLIDYAPVKHLRLDRENPRLPSTDLKTDLDLIKFMWKEMAVDEVALSIAANGFFPEEPLLVIPEVKGKKNFEKDSFIVVEGNRRLVAVLLLCDSVLREN